MQIDISSRHKIPLQPTLKEYALIKTHKLDKYSLKIEQVHIVFDVEKINHTCEIVLLAKNLRLTATETTQDMQSSFDMAMSNIQNQLRRYHDKIKHHDRSKIQIDEGEVTNADEVEY